MRRRTDELAGIVQRELEKKSTDRPLNVFIAGDHKVRLDADYLLLFAGNFADVALSSMLTGRDYQVIMVYLSAMAYGNLLELPQVAIAERLGVSKQSVSRSVRKLVDAGILLRSNNGALYFNLNLAMRGRSAELFGEYFDLLRDSVQASQKCGHSITPVVGIDVGIKDTD